MNIRDYIKWRGDLSFKQDPFNIVDNLLFCQMIYTDLRGIVPENGHSITLKEASNLFFAKHDEKELLESKSFVAVAPFVLRDMANSRRFSDLKLHHYVHILDSEEPIQFSAVQIDLNGRETFIAFCGTDDTMTGWKEDLQMSYKLVRSQTEAVNYVNNKTRLARRYYIGGHSKGGNLAVYAGLYCQNIIQERLIHIYNNDGPGIADWLSDEERFEKIRHKYTKIIPDSSAIGTIYFDEENLMAVKADAGFGHSHSCLTWQVEGKQLELSDKRTESSLIVQKAIELFVIKTTPEDRHQFIDNLFEAFDMAGIDTVSKMLEEGLPVVIKLLMIMKNDDYSFSEIYSEMAKCLLKVSNERVSTKVSEVPELAQSFVDDLKKRIKRK